MKRRYLTPTVLSSMFIATVAIAQERPKIDRVDTLAAGRASRSSAQEKPDIREALNRRVNIDWDELAFEDVVDWLRDQTGLNVIVRWPAIRGEGVQEDSPVSLRLTDVPIWQVLNETVRQIADFGRIRYQGSNGTLIISTRSDFDRDLFLRVANVADLIIPIPDFGSSAPHVDIAQVQAGSAGGSGATAVLVSPGDGGDEGGGGEAAKRMEIEQLDQLITVILATAASEFTDDERSAIVGFGRMLIIRAPIEVHEAIDGTFVRD